MIKPAYSVSFLLSINIFVWPNVLYFPNDLRICLSLTIHLPFYPEDGGGRIARNTVATKIYVITSKKTVILIFTDLRASNLLG